MLQLENTLHNLIRAALRLVHLHRAIVLADDRLLFRKIANAPENEIRRTRSDLHIQLLTERIHVATDLLEVHRRHVDDASEVEARDLDILNVRVEELEEVVRNRRLLAVLHPDTELVRVARR